MRKSKKPDLRKVLEIVNSDQRDWTKHRYILAFGAYGWTRLLVWGNSLEEALDSAIDWIAEHAPGLLCDSEVDEAFRLALEQGKPEEDAWEEAQVDTTCGGNNGHFLHSWEWQIVKEDPTRQQVKACLDEWAGGRYS